MLNLLIPDSISQIAASCFEKSDVQGVSKVDAACSQTRSSLRTQELQSAGRQLSQYRNAGAQRKAALELDLLRSGFSLMIPAITDFRARGTIIGLAGLTAVFGMGTGVTPPVWSPEMRPADGQAGPGAWFWWSGHSVGWPPRPIGPCRLIRPIGPIGRGGRGARRSQRVGWWVSPTLHGTTGEWRRSVIQRLEPLRSHARSIASTGLGRRGGQASRRAGSLGGRRLGTSLALPIRLQEGSAGASPSRPENTSQAAPRSGWSSCLAVRTGRLKRSPAVHARPIDLVVFQEPTHYCWKPHLGGGFALRCLQRLSGPDLATRRCRERDSRYTRGRSSPILSY